MLNSEITNKDAFFEKAEELDMYERCEREIKKIRKQRKKLKRRRKEMWHVDTKKQKKKIKKLNNKLKTYEHNRDNLYNLLKKENTDLRICFMRESYRNRLWQALYLMGTKEGQKELTKYLMNDVTNLAQLPPSALEDLSTAFVKGEALEDGKDFA